MEGGREGERERERERERVLRLDGNLGRALHTHRGEAFRGCTRAGRSGHELWHSHLTYTRAMALTPNLHQSYGTYTKLTPSQSLSGGRGGGARLGARRAERNTRGQGKY